MKTVFFGILFGEKDSKNRFSYRMCRIPLLSGINTVINTENNKNKSRQPNPKIKLVLCVPQAVLSSQGNQLLVHKLSHYLYQSALSNILARRSMDQHRVSCEAPCV